MALSKSNPQYKPLDVGKIVVLPLKLRFVVYDKRLGKDFRRAHEVAQLGCDSNGEVTFLAFVHDSSSFEPAGHYSTRLPT